MAATLYRQEKADGVEKSQRLFSTPYDCFAALFKRNVFDTRKAVALLLNGNILAFAVIIDPFSLP